MGTGETGDFAGDPVVWFECNYVHDFYTSTLGRRTNTSDSNKSDSFGVLNAYGARDPIKSFQ